MEHLSTEEIIKYVTASKVNDETLALISKVNVHIRECSLCKEKILAYEHVNEKLKIAMVEKDIDLFCELIQSKKEKVIE